MNSIQTSEPKVEKHLASARKRALAIILTPVVVTVIWAFWVGVTTEPVRLDTRFPAPVLGKPAPFFTFPLLGGGTDSLTDYREKVVLVNVWATWCPPCIDEMPDLENLYKKMKTKGAPFEILGVSIDALGADPVRKWVDRFEITFPILLDSRGSVKKLYRTTGVPETFVIDPKGILIRKFIGPRKWDGPGMIRYLEGVLKASIPTSS
ncbi:MAG: TlpA disulfide reductase family protein [Nitrospinota bacterium]|jgi:peroxiredoxin|nr:TlpA disulfide reductase family protein [Nitrospinota bacterium]